MPILKGLALLKGIQKKLSFSYEVVGIRSSCYCCMQLNVISKERLCCDSWLPGGIHVCFLNGVHDQLLLRLSFLILMASSKIFVLGIHEMPRFDEAWPQSSTFPLSQLSLCPFAFEVAEPTTHLCLGFYLVCVFPTFTNWPWTARCRTDSWNGIWNLTSPGSEVLIF